MLIDKINLNHLRIFECVYKNRSMTKSADKLFLTQSGISQHIKHLEEVLQVKLFDRIKHRLIPTEDAKQLYEKSSQGLLQIEDALMELSSQKDLLRGTVSIGLPIEFGNNIILPLLSEFGKRHPEIRFSILYGYATDMEKLILCGDLDMAIVDDYSFDQAIQRCHIYDEELHLCMASGHISQGEIRELAVKKYFERLDYIKYKKDEALINNWFKHHYGFTSMRLNVKAVLMNIEGVARLITSGLGAGILSHHMINKLRGRGVQLHVFQGRKGPLINKISIAYLEKKSISKAVSHLHSYLQEESNLLFSETSDFIFLQQNKLQQESSFSPKR